MSELMRLDLQAFRHFDSFSIQFGKGLNIISGPNASGKTTILEAIYMLAHGKSFRVSNCDKAIMHDKKMLTLFAVGKDRDQFCMGLQKGLQKSIKLQLNKESAKSIRLLADHLPIQLITTQSARYFTDGPKLRRDFLAWGLFYTSSEFYALWKQYQRALAQRNKDLKRFDHSNTTGYWDAILSEMGEAIDRLYKNYVEQINEPFQELISLFLPDKKMGLHYTRGWDDNICLKDALVHSLNRSQMLGYTVVGIHRCDLKVLCNELDVQECLSRGQLKLASYALALAQGVLLKKMTGQCPIYLIDDLTAELDQHKQEVVLTALEDLQAQVLVTMIDPEGVKNSYSHHEVRL